MKLIGTVLKNPVRTSQKTQYFSSLQMPTSSFCLRKYSFTARRINIPCVKKRSVLMLLEVAHIVTTVLKFKSGIKQPSPECLSFLSCSDALASSPSGGTERGDDAPSARHDSSWRTLSKLRRPNLGRLAGWGRGMGQGESDRQTVLRVTE